MKRIGHLTYSRSDGSFWLRPIINGRRTWRRLTARTKSEALGESAALLTDQKRATVGLAADPFAPAGMDWGELIQSKDPGLAKIFPVPPTVISADYHYAQRAGKRAAEMEITRAKSAMDWGIKRGIWRENTLSGWRAPRREIVHCREFMPESGDELQDVLERLLPSPIGWQAAFEALTGCRTSEVLAFRTDAVSKGDPGWREGKYLYVRRSKRGLFPFVEIHDALDSLLRAHSIWHASGYGTRSRWFFPGQSFGQPLTRFALAHALNKLPGPRRTSHGLRAFAVTVWRSHGESNEQVASRIGDRTSRLIETTYGSLPESWAGGEPLSWLRKDGTNAWSQLVPDNVVKMEVAA